MARRATRRELMVGAAAALAGVTAGAAGGSPRPALADASGPSDGELMGKALLVERLMVLAYRRVLASGALTPGVQRAIMPHLGHELAHVQALAARLRALGAPAPT